MARKVITPSFLSSFFSPLLSSFFYLHFLSFSSSSLSLFSSFFSYLLFSLSQGLILVTINYRVGLFGFFAHSQLTKENPQVPTNFGLLDMVVALKWVKKHISFFGGDPDDVTVFGTIKRKTIKKKERMNRRKKEERRKN